MADNLPINFPLPSESAIASYNYQDIAAGLGYKTFYLVDPADTASTKYVLSPEAITTGGTTGGLLTAGTYTFTTSTFNSPRILKGTAYFYGKLVRNASNQTAAVTIKVNATAISSTITSPTYTATSPFCLEVPLTETRVKRGDTISAVVTITGATGGAVIDPQGDIRAETPSMQVNLPFKIDL
jgi:hypothetical protein